MASPQAEAPAFRIRDAEPEDATVLSRFAAETFHAAFAWGNAAADMEAYMRDAYTPARQRAEIEDADGATLLVESGEELIGYAQLGRNAPGGGVDAERPVELKRFYVAPSWHGRGVAQALMDAVMARARSWQADVLWLGVWKRNPRAIAFYRKAGYVEAGTQVFQLGSDAQTDMVMVLRLVS